MFTWKDSLHLGIALLGFYVVLWITLPLILFLGGPTWVLAAVGPIPAFLVGAKLYRKMARDEW